MKSQPKSKIELPQPSYLIGDIVYYNIPENSEPGIVSDMVFSAYTNKWSYNVSFGPGNEVNCTAEEITNKKRLI